MTAAYGELRRDVLSRVRKYSIAGQVTPASYNCQADDLHRIGQAALGYFDAIRAALGAQALRSLGNDSRDPVAFKHSRRALRVSERSAHKQIM